jgi:hypothetical protein
MPEHHRALLALLLIGLAVQPLAGRLAPEQLAGGHALRRGLWFALTACAFALGNFWMFGLLALGLLLWARGRDENAPALFLALLFVVPPVQLDIPGFGLMNFFFSLSFPRLLSLVLLLPLFVRLVARPRPPAGGWVRVADLLFLGHVCVQLALLERESSVTSALRSVFYLFVDLCLPYYVFSRAFDSVRKIHDAAAALVVAGVMLAAIAVFEASRHWLLYSSLATVWGSTDQLIYLGRSGVLRAMASTGHAIALGYVLAICLLLYLPMHSRLPRGWRAGVLLLLGAGLFAPLSRGPWIGAACGLLLYLLLGPRPLRNVALLGAGGITAVGVLALLPFGAFVLDLVPFVGTVEMGNLTYRQRLMEAASELIWRNPVLGSSDYTQRLAEMGLTQGQGIVDIVNTYLQVALRSGFTGLVLFAGFLLATLLCGLAGRSAARQARQRSDADLGRSLAAAQLAVIVTIGSVSSILVIPWMYWCLAGLLVGYARAVRAQVAERREVVAAPGFA